MAQITGIIELNGWAVLLVILYLVTRALTATR